MGPTGWWNRQLGSRSRHVLLVSLLGLATFAFAIASAGSAYAASAIAVTAVPGNKSGQIFMQWPSIESATQYKVCANSTCTFLSSDTTNHVFNGLSPGTQYTLNVTALSSSGQTLASGSTTAYPAGASIPDVTLVAPGSSADEIEVQVQNASSTDTYVAADGSYKSPATSPSSGSVVFEIPTADATIGSTIDVTAFGNGNADEASAQAELAVLPPVEDLSALIQPTGTLTVSWEAPTLPGGATFSNYSVVISGNGQQTSPISTTSTSLSELLSKLSFSPTSVAVQVDATDSSYNALGYVASEQSVAATAPIGQPTFAPPPPEPRAVGETCGAGGTLVEIWGRNLAGTTVDFAGVDAGPVSVLSSTEVEVEAPHGITRVGRIVVTGPGGSVAVPGWVRWNPACATETVAWATPAPTGAVTLHVAVVGQGNSLSGKTIIVLDRSGEQVARLTTSSSPSTVVLPIADGPFQAIFDGSAHWAASQSGNVA